MKKYLAGITVIVISVIVIAIYASSPVTNTRSLKAAALSDISEHKYRNAIEFIASRGIVQGYSDGTYKPDKTVNRSELLKIVLESNIASETLKQFDGADCFPDVSPDTWAAKYACAAKNAGIVQGYDDGTFKPNKTVSFIEALKIMQIAYGLPFSVSQDAWYRKSVEDAAAMNIIPLDTMSFDQGFTRAQMAEMLTRLIKYKEDALAEYLSDKKDQRVTYEKIENRQRSMSTIMTYAEPTAAKETEDKKQPVQSDFSDKDYKDETLMCVYITPTRLIPYVSRAESRKSICSLALTGIPKSLCASKYDGITMQNTSEIQELFNAINNVLKYENSDLNKYLTAHLVFSSLPIDIKTVTQDTSSIRFAQSSSNYSQFIQQALAQAEFPTNAPAEGIGRDGFEQMLRADIASVMNNCPQEGYENYVLTVMCSDTDHYNPGAIYSEQYVESGGLCVGEDAGAFEKFQPNSIISSYQLSSTDLGLDKKKSISVSCAFSCGSFNCPKHTQDEIARKKCANPIYEPVGYISGTISQTAQPRRLDQTYENIEFSCERRGFLYSTDASGLSVRNITQTCGLIADSCDLVVRKYSFSSMPVLMLSCCCECERKSNTMTGWHDWTSSAYEGPKILRDLIEYAKNQPVEPVSLITDRPPTPPIVEQPPKEPIIVDGPPTSPPAEEPPVIDTLPIATLPSTPESTPTAPQPEPEPEPEQEQETPAIYHRFMCNSWKEPSYEPGIIEYMLKAETYYCNKDGGDMFIQGGYASINGLCMGPNLDSSDGVPRCVDPRTKQPVQGALDFIMAYPTDKYTEQQAQQEIDDFFWTMTSYKKPCGQEDIQIPPGYYD